MVGLSSHSRAVVGRIKAKVANGLRVGCKPLFERLVAEPEVKNVRAFLHCAQEQLAKQHLPRRMARARSMAKVGLYHMKLP